MAESLVLLSVPASWSPGAKRLPGPFAQVTPLYRHRLAGSLDGSPFLCDAYSLPLPSNRIDRVECAHTLEILLDDERMMDEISRILRPGGSVSIMVPRSGGLGRLDALNIRRYALDILHSGRQTEELAESGWRRHYDSATLADLAQRAGFGDRDIRVGWSRSMALAGLRALPDHRTWRLGNAFFSLGASQRSIANCRRLPLPLRWLGNVLVLDAVKTQSDQ
jgi:SAM-dependent methyltransferase